MLNKKLKYLEVRFITFAYTSMASKSLVTSLECSNSVNVMISNYVLCF